MGEIKITLETLYDILRNEKKREDLQKLEDSFFVDVVSYLREKQSLLDNKTKETNPFASGEQEKLEYELRSIRRILKQIYEMREKKIIDIALNRSRTGSDIIDTSAMLRVEKDFYQNNLDTMDKYRRGILLQLFKSELPDVEMYRRKEALPPSPKIKLKERVVLKENTPPKIATDQKTMSSTTSIPTPSSNPLSNTVKTKIKFTHPVPSFVWKDMKEYGPFEQGEETTIFPEVADLLV